MRTVSHHWKALAIALVAIATTSALLGKNLRARQTPQTTDRYVEVSSVKVDPATLHTTGKPNSALVTVQILIIGKMPENASAKVEIATNSTSPAGIRVHYGPAQNVSLTKSPAVAQFNLQLDREVSPGKVAVRASVVAITAGIRIKTSEEPQDYLGDLQIVSP